MGTSPLVPKTPYVPAALIGVKYCRPFKRRSFCVASLRPFKLSMCLPNDVYFLNKCNKTKFAQVNRELISFPKQFYQYVIKMEIETPTDPWQGSLRFSTGIRYSSQA